MSSCVPLLTPSMKLTSTTKAKKIPLRVPPNFYLPHPFRCGYRLSSTFFAYSRVYRSEGSRSAPLSDHPSTPLVNLWSWSLSLRSAPPRLRRVNLERAETPLQFCIFSRGPYTYPPLSCSCECPERRAAIWEEPRISSISCRRL